MKLEAHRIDGEILQWTGNWLSDAESGADWAVIRLERCPEWRSSGISFGPTPVLDLYQ